MGKKDDAAREAWAMVPDEVKPLVLSTVFCPSCGHTAMAAGFAMHMEGPSLVLEGLCVKCGHEVCRIIEDPTAKSRRGELGL